MCLVTEMRVTCGRAVLVLGGDMQEASGGDVPESGLEYNHMGQLSHSAIQLSASIGATDNVGTERHAH